MARVNLGGEQKGSQATGGALQELEAEQHGCRGGNLRYCPKCTGQRENFTTKCMPLFPTAHRSKDADLQEVLWVMHLFSPAQIQGEKKKKKEKKKPPLARQNPLWVADTPHRQSSGKRGLIFNVRAQAGRSQDSGEFQIICLKKHKKYVFKILLPFLGQTGSRYSSAGGQRLYFSKDAAHHLNNGAKHLYKQNWLGFVFDGK